MKRRILSALGVLIIVGLSGFSGKNLPSVSNAFNGKKFHPLVHLDGDAWISSNYDFQACTGQHYFVVGGSPGDTYHWYVTYNNPDWGTQDLGYGSDLYWELSPGDELTLVVDEGTPDEYEYYNTATPCGE